MRSLSIDYVRLSSRVLWARTAIVLVAIGFALDTGYRYFSLKTEIERMAMASAHTAGMPEAPLLSATRVIHSTSEYNFARQTLGRLAMPWDRLFEALEAAHSERIVLLAVEPDAENRTVTITGESKDYLTALAYLANLAQQESLQQVHLVHHEMRQQPSSRPLLFSISAAWKEGR
jgi:hypothetical protein